jgi:hypothetical protein
MKRECPECNVTLTRFEKSRLWWLSASMSGRLVQPCSGCGRLLRLSAMHAFTAIGSLGLIALSIARVATDSQVVLVLALVCAVMIFVGMVSTRLEVVRQLQEPNYSGPMGLVQDAEPLRPAPTDRQAPPASHSAARAS